MTFKFVLELIGVDGRTVVSTIQVVHSERDGTGEPNSSVSFSRGAEIYEAPITPPEFDALWKLTRKPISVFGKANHAENIHWHQLTISEGAASATYRWWAGAPAVGWDALGAIASAMEQLSSRVIPVQRSGHHRRPKRP